MTTDHRAVSRPLALDATARRISDSEVVPENPYWQAHARAFADPDGFQLLLAMRR